jgi:type VI secretion system protein ImpK
MHRSARPLIALATQLRTAVPAKPAETGAALAAAVERFEHDLVEAGCDARSVTAASFLLCVWLDEVIAPHAWAGATWPANSVLLRFHDEPDGRARVFQLLDRLVQQPVADRPLLELFHVCLSLGLQGRWQEAADGTRQLAALRTRLAELLRLGADPLSAPLSTRWQPAVTERKPGLGPRLAVAGLMLIALAGLGLYTSSQWRLAAQADQVFASLHGLERASRSAERTATLAAAVPKPSAQASPSPSPGRLAAALAAELRTGEISVRDEPHRSLIVLATDGLFQPDTTQLAKARLPLLERVAQALASNGGRVLVTAYARADTARSARLPSASQLADEWARHVAQVLQQRLPAGSVASEGRVARQDEPAGSPNGTGVNSASGPRNLIEITLYP